MTRAPGVITSGEGPSGWFLDTRLAAVFVGRGWGCGRRVGCCFTDLGDEFFVAEVRWWGGGRAERLEEVLQLGAHAVVVIAGCGAGLDLAHCWCRSYLVLAAAFGQMEIVLQK